MHNEIKRCAAFIHFSNKLSADLYPFILPLFTSSFFSNNFSSSTSKTGFGISSSSTPLYADFI